MKKYLSEKLKEIRYELGMIDIESCDIPIEVCKSIVKYLKGCLDEIRTRFLSVDFISKEEEINFFKKVKPKILGFLLYFNKIYGLELKCPNGSNETLRKFYQKELKSLTFFFERNLYFYQYYRSKSTQMDEYYFTRTKPYLIVPLDSAHFIMDSSFSTGHDYKASKIICNEMLRIYLNKKILTLDKQMLIGKNRASFSVNNLKWTGSKAALVELGYSFEASKFINGGNADIKQIMTALEVIFNIDLGDYYRTYVSIKERKIDRTKYLNQLINGLLERMDKDDC